MSGSHPFQKKEKKKKKLTELREQINEIRNKKWDYYYS